MHISVTFIFRHIVSVTTIFNIYLLCGKIPCDDVHRHQKARVCPCGYHFFTGNGTCATNTGTGIYRSLCRGTDSSAQSMASGRVVFVLFLQQRSGARGKITIWTSTPEATMLSMKKIQAWYTFLFFHL